MSEISVIGMGAMGSALAGTLLDKGHDVTVWNRTAAKAQPLGARGASVAASPAEAVAASPATIVCVSGYGDSLELLESAEAALAGTVLIQLSTGTGKEVEDFAAWASERGSDVLIGTIEAYPSAIGTDVATLLIAGPEHAWDNCREMLLELGPASMYLGDDVALPEALSDAVISPVLGIVLGTLHGLLVCEKSGFPVSDYVELLPLLLGVASDQAQYLARTVAEDRFDSPEAALRTYAAAIEMRARDHRERGVDDEFLTFLDGLCRRAIEAGHGEEELSALIKLWR